MNARQLTILVCFAISCGAASAGTLEGRFKSPPDSARPWVYWTCQDGHYSMEGATADLESMKNAGIGGVLRMDCNVGGIPFGGTPYLSERWRKQFVHAVHECERLGLEFTTITGPGWTGTGGPWIRAEQSMQHLVPASVIAKGPASFNQMLPLPQPRISRYHRNQTPQMQKEISEFYKDVALFAFPRRDPMIEDIQEKALFVRNPFTSMPGVRPHLPSPVSYPTATAAQVIDPKDIIDLTGKLQADGRLTWEVPPGEWTIVRLGVRSTGANTRPAPSAGLGLESDKFNKDALAAHFEAFFDPLLKEIGSRLTDRKVGFVALDADSWEMSSQNWTPGFREEFKRRRGYDPWLYFTTYTGCVVGSREQTERFLWDVRTVCQELLLENHAAELRKLCHQRGLRLMIEPYDMNPAGDLDLGSYADFPAGELWFDGFQSGWSCITAASIAHTMGKSVVLAEAFTSGRGNWQRTPWILKNQTDWAFAVGINKLSIHGFAHQSDENSPGMTFGPYGVFWNRKQTFWPLIADYHEYLARCSHMLQQGVTVSDILYLTPEGAPQVFLPPPSALNAAESRLPDKKGYSFDGCSPNILMDRAEVKDGRIVFPGGTSYRMLVLPRFATMTPKLLETITQLVQAGAIVYGAPPIASPSLSGYPQCDTKVQDLAKQLWGESTPSVRHLDQGRMVLDAGGEETEELYPDYATTAAVLEQMKVPQDFQSDGPVRYTHRQTNSADIYFIANTSNQAVKTNCTFRVQQGLPQLWDPVTTEIRPLPEFTHDDRTTSVPVTFQPHQSFFVIFPRSATSKPAAFASLVNFPKAKPVSTIKGAWEVSFDPKWGGPAKVIFDNLQDWSKHSEHGIKYYSGIATYRKSFDLPRQSGNRIYLDLGTVHDIARVRLNGKDLGVVWCAPWRVDISNSIKPGKNQLEIEVANRWSNRLIGDAALPPEKRLTKSHVTPFKKDVALLPSGLLGPVQLLIDSAASATTTAPPKYRDGRPEATLRMDAQDHGIVLRYGDGPDKCDILGARDAWVFEDSGTYYMHYDAAGPKGWLCSLAVSNDLVTWEKKGPILDFGKPGEDDAKSASYGVTYHDGKAWHMFYLGTPNVSPAPNLVPGFPYLTMKAKASSPAGPWVKQKAIVPFRTKPYTYYSLTASPGQTIKNGDEFLQFFSATTRKPGNPSVQRTLGIARTKNLDGPWKVDPKPMVPIEEQIENSTIYYEKNNKTWFLFTNHIGINRGEYTDAIWVYWSKDLDQWDPANKAVVLDGQNCNWSTKCIGLPSVVPVGERLALFYDAPEGNSTSHMRRHIGLAWLDLPLSVPRFNE